METWLGQTVLDSNSPSKDGVYGNMAWTNRFGFQFSKDGVYGNMDWTNCFGF
jgi:hypothetical protein